MKETRFHYIDAAVQGYIYKKATEVDSFPKEGVESFDEHFRKLNSMVESINQTIMALMTAYIEYCRKKNI